MFRVKLIIFFPKVESCYCLVISSCHHSMNYILTHFITLKKLSNGLKLQEAIQIASTDICRSWESEIAAMRVVILGSTPQHGTVRCLNLLYFSLAPCCVSKFSYGRDPEHTKFFVFPLCTSTGSEAATLRNLVPGFLSVSLGWLQHNVEI